jgi:hypothetical protein
MNFWKYLLKNRLWIMLTFLALCGLLLIAWHYQPEDSTLDRRALLIALGLIVPGFIIASFVAWKKSR